jgi:glycosyltransferase involved in cell wall biosynthesis
MRKVLIITYHFPPRPTVGSVRLRGLAKYLPEFGWEPIILTAELPGDPDPQFKVIQTPYRDIIRYWKRRLGLDPDKMTRQQFGDNSYGVKSRLVKAFLYLGRDIIAYPDEAKGWYRFATEAGNELLKQKNIDAMISSCQPPTCHLIAKALKTRWGIPWIADFRDLWAQGYIYRKDHNFLRRLIERRLMFQTVSKADALVTVSKPLVRSLVELYPRRAIYEIPNGFDPAEQRVDSPNGLTNEFTITYAGSLHGCLRDPSSLFVAVKDLISEGSMHASGLQIRFYGQWEPCLERLIEHYGMQKIAEQYGVVSREVSLQKQRESQLLLLLNWSDDPALGVYTGKLFEYLAAQRPILSMGKAGGVIEELLNETGAGGYASTVNDIKDFLTKCYSEYRSRGEVIYRGRELKIRKYSHFGMARKFSEVLKDLSERV